MKTIRMISIATALLFAAVVSNAQTGLANVTTTYLSVKNALAAGSGEQAQAGAKELFAALSADPGKGLNAEQQKTLEHYIDKLKFDARHISETTDIDHQREHFANLSKNLFEVLKDTKTAPKTLYEQYCPMKKADWLSESPKIKNPYYNSGMMSSCGSTKTTLAAAR